MFEAYLGELKKLRRDMDDWDLSDAESGRLFVHGLGIRYYDMVIDYFEANRDKLFEEEE